MTPATYCSTDVNGLKVFYRQSGPPEAPKLLLLHGYPSASHMFRDLIPQLADHFHVIAPDLLGFGQSDMPSRDTFTYTFKALTDVLEGFTDAAGLDRYVLYVFNYGAPTGFRLALRRPERIAAITRITNGNFRLTGRLIAQIAGGRGRAPASRVTAARQRPRSRPGRQGSR